MEGLTLADLEFLTYRLMGGCMGAFLALVTVWPSSRRDFAARVTVSLVSALIFTPQIRDYLGWLPAPDNIVSAAAVSGLFSWWAISAIIAALRAGWLPGLRNGKK